MPRLTNYVYVHIHKKKFSNVAAWQQNYVDCHIAAKKLLSLIGDYSTSMCGTGKERFQS